MEIVKEEVKKLVEKGCVIRVTSKPRFCNPLSVAEKKGKKRMVIDLSRCLNIHLDNRKFKMDDLNRAIEQIRPMDYLVLSLIHI